MKNYVLVLILFTSFFLLSSCSSFDDYLKVPGSYLLELFEENIEDEIYDFFYEDYENNEIYSAFVFTKKKDTEEDDEKFIGSLWYIDEQDCILLMDDIESFHYEPMVIENEDSKHLLFEIFKGLADSSTSYFWAVKDNKPELVFSTPNYCFINDEQLVIVDTYISMSDEGRVWSWYYLYWDSKEQKYKEYVGKEIAREEFISYVNAELIDVMLLSTLRNKFKEIDNVEKQYIKRENGIININYSFLCGEETFYYHVTLSTSNNAIAAADFNDFNIFSQGNIKESGGF